ncbi:aldo/keto reductase [Rubrivivax benzoatilyticus]|uniref:Oxidoreductase n=1 Tax=Rubrivivax benzoatilyticus TaxID=316997 RepID=A0ABX0HVX4_9BURK|nr:aldo/keto reductase [Rubrivivax benzoatilyticus]EGJ11608.1 aldo/keto reductase [Rubrivivax benzoatilyticus JA2 = ATCC BAA-35]NHK99158.1 oxidoreductase [Rubrivivax benzoatilyticus]NHL24979.1 oxidoreductase [Rubrivivax benzoatilyticus]
MDPNTSNEPHGGLLSPIVAGCWRLHEWGLDVAARVRWIERTLELGITTFDHADIYGGYRVEALFGEALAAAPGLRQRLRLVSKCGIKLVGEARPAHAIKSYDSSRDHIVASVEASLRALRTDRLDLLLLHRPDLLADPDEVAATFDALRRAGKVLHFGVSNHTPSQFALLHRRFPLVTNQVELSPLQMQALADGTLEQALDLGLPPMIWSPLGGGRLFRGDDEQARRVRAVLEALGAEHGVSAATVAYAWILRHPSRPVPITGSSRIEALAEATAALALRLPAEAWYRVWQASMGHEVA